MLRCYLWSLELCRGAEIAESYRAHSNSAPIENVAPERIERDAVEAASPRIGNIHRISNAFGDRTSIGIHVYGGNMVQ